MLLMTCVLATAQPSRADITNTASATGTYAGKSFTSSPVTVGVLVAPPKPAIGIVKTGTFNDINGNGFADVNDTITYAFLVSNLGTVTLTNINVIDNKIGAVTCAVTTLAPNQTTTCAGPAYPLTQADVDAGSVSNQATATAKAPDGTPVSDLSDPKKPGVGNDAPTVVTFKAGNPNMTLTKVDTFVGSATVGATITYKFTVINTGGVTLHNIDISDAGATKSGGPIVSLPPGLSDTTTFTASHVLTGPEIASGSYTNTATATATPSPAGPITGSATTTLNTNAAMSFTKSGVLANGTLVPPKAGDKVNYTLVVTNTGPTPLFNVSVSDPLLASVVSPGSQQVALIDMVAGSDAVDFATASFDLAGTRSGIVASSNRRAHLEFTGGIGKAEALGVSRQLVRISGATGDVQPGEKIGVLYSISNGGSDIISDIAVSQPDSVTFGGRISRLESGDTDGSSMIFTRDVTAEEILAGVIKSNAYLTFNQMGHDRMQVVTESLPLSSIKTYDDVATASISPTVVPELDAGQTFSFAAPYTLIQADIDAGTVHNLATATAKDSGGARLIKTATFDLSLQQAPQVGVVKTGTLTFKNGVSAQVGDKITYKFAVTNLGNVTLTNVKVTDPPVNMAGAPIASLAPTVTDSTTYSATYTITQTDIDKGSYQNQASVIGIAPGGASTPLVLSDNADPKQHRPTVVPIGPSPAIGLLKKVTKIVDTNNNGRNDVDDVIQYQFTVYNLGNVTLTNIDIKDTVGGGANVKITGGPILSLAPGLTSSQITGSYPITQADMDAGRVDNTATVTGFAPDGTPVSHDSDPTVPTQSSPTPQLLVQQPQVTLYKKMTKWDDVNSDGIIDAGDVLHYTFTVVNPGNVTLTNLQLTDTPNVPTGTVVVPNQQPGLSLAPGATNVTMFAYAYTITSADEAAGAVKNRATVAATQANTNTTVSATSLNGDPSQNTNTTTDTIISSPIAVELLPPSYAPSATNTTNIAQVGDILTYKVYVKNPGGAALNTITLADYGTGVMTAGTFAGTLQPNAIDTTSFTATHVLTQADITAGIYNAQVKITANDANVVAGPTVTVTDLSDPADYNKNAPTPYLIAGNPQIGVVKAFDHFELASGTITTTPSTGDFAIYKITVSNLGGLAFDSVTVAELSPYVGPMNTTAAISLATNTSDSTTYSVKHLLTNAEFLAGHVDNQVVASGTNTTKSITVTSKSDPNDPNQHNVTTTALVTAPSLTVTKTYKVTDANGNGLNDAGDTINYTFTVVNNGNIDLTNITISDPNATMLGTGPIALLKIGQKDATTFSGTHLITVSDVATGAYSNQATLMATEITGGVLSDNGQNSGAATPKPTVTPLQAAKPILTKVAKRSQVKRGEVVAYIISASNVNIGPFQLADIMPPGFSYVGDSAQVNGVAVTPVINATTLTFNNLIPLNTKIILTLNLTAQATLSSGQFVNNARLIDPSTNAVLAVAQATVEVIPEAVFDCSDVIGRVFDDANGDGYMQDGEKGLAGVRLATVNGTLITTDAQGRFHIPCAAIPDGAIGSNFLLKIDPRTLPFGYKITSENPRMVRLTRGKVTEINFGATKVHDVKVDLTGGAFDPGSADLTEKWSLGVDRLVDILRKRRSELTLVYHKRDESDELAQARVAAVASLVQEAFASSKGGYALSVKTNVELGK